jgi:SAM-dependent methyltransferase
MDAGDWDRRYAETTSVWSEGPNRFVEEELGSLAPGRAVDLAAGEGRNALWLAARGWRVAAVDFSAVALDKGRMRQERAGALSGQVEWVHADVLTYDAGDRSFDLVLLAYLQLPADDRKVVVRRSFAMLRPGGTFFLVAHDRTNLTEGTGGPQDASVLYTAEDVLADLAGSEVEVQNAGRVARVVDSTHSGTHTHDGQAQAVAYDAMVRLVRAG